MLLTALLRCFPGGAISLPAMRETWVQSLAWDDPLEKGMATHSSMLAWGIPIDEKRLPGYSPWGRKESDTAKHSTQCPLKDAGCGGDWETSFRVVNSILLTEKRL